MRGLGVNRSGRSRKHPDALEHRLATVVAPRGCRLGVRPASMWRRRAPQTFSSPHEPSGRRRVAIVALAAMFAAIPFAYGSRSDLRRRARLRGCHPR